jgi:hypothetical protein
MKIVGCDLHARQQTIAILDTETGQFSEKTLGQYEESGYPYFCVLHGLPPDGDIRGKKAVRSREKAFPVDGLTGVRRNNRHVVGDERAPGAPVTAPVLDSTRFHPN